MVNREISVCQQTWALLCKNLIRKKRMRRDTILECLYSAILLVSLYMFPEVHQVYDFSFPTVSLGRIDSFNDSTFTIAYTPDTQTTQRIMNKVSSASFMKGIKVMAFPEERNMTESHSSDEHAVRVIFTNTYSYHLKFPEGAGIPTIKEHEDHSAHCHMYGMTMFCYSSMFWTDGFVTLQAAINAAIIEVTTNHSVMEELMSVTGTYMKTDPFIAQGGIMTDFFIFICIICFSPFTYYVSAGVTRERKRMKGLMKAMGLRDSAFWLSWGLLYTAIICIMSLFLALIVKEVQFVIRTGFMAVFSLFFFYGLSLITLSFLMSILLKKSFLTDFVVFILTVFWGSLGFASLYRYIPMPLEWILCVFSPFAFTLGMAQLLHVDFDINSNTDTMSNSNLIMATTFMLFFDTSLYLVLTFYFEKVLPNEYGHRYSPLFFLKSSFWSQQKMVVLENEMDYEFSDESFEPVSTEFHGKEAIRIRNLTKEYSGKPKCIEALKDLALDIYEGQITAILGHSGAGKSTLLNILGGLCVPTKGWVTIYNNKLSEMNDLECISKFTGVCPQCNVQFDFLTVRENLRLFAKIKGIHPHEVNNEVQRILLELEMKNIQNVLAQNLSGGQKRKLTFGIAILGDPQIFLLDEPTAGLDPFSRHRVWNLLKERKAGRVVLFSTQFMDEADILADRKVFLSKGKLKCAGSSLFLKKKWGIGYHLSLQLNGMCVQEKITSLVRLHIPEARLSAESEDKLSYILPLERTNKFPDLYRDLESCFDLGIENYGVSMTTLNEVFLSLEGKSAVDQSDASALLDTQAAGTRDTAGFVEMEQLVCSLNGMKKTQEGMALWWQQLRAVTRLRFLKLKHERKAICMLILAFGVGLLHILASNAHRIAYQDDYCWDLSPNMYFLAPNQQPRDPLTNLLIINKTGTKIDDFIHALEQQNIALEVDAFGARNGTDETLYNGAIIVSGDKKNYNFTLSCNTKRLNCFPVLMDIVSNGLLGLFTPSVRIQTDRSTFYKNNPHGFNCYNFMFYIISWILLMTCVSPYISMTNIDDYKSKTQFQLWASGLYPSAYWFGQALVEVPIYSLLILFMYVAYYAVHLQGVVFATLDLFIQILYIVGYATSIIFMTYMISFLSRKGRKNSGIWSFCFYIVTLFSVTFELIEYYRETALFCITLLIPPATLVGCTLLHFEYRAYNDLVFIEPARKFVYLLFLTPFVHIIIFLVILRYLEFKLGKKTMRKDPVFRIASRSAHVCPNPEEAEGEDEDVTRERARTADALTSADFEEKPAIIASCLRKEYSDKKKCFYFKKKKKIATRNISFCVRKGEVVGLLGHNGAGKSTCIKMITGETKPSAGQVLLNGSSRGDDLGFLGYCPQENNLWPNLTVREHLEVFAAVKGLSKGDAMVAITRLVDALKLQDQLKAPVKTLSEGVKRKLCFVLSVLGNPSVVLLDEPSTGMDPEGQQQMWQAIRATFANSKRGALLTTHYMAEAEAVCDRVAIMVSGRLRCIGSIQHLKSKFGKEYQLEMKVRTPAQVEALHSEILRIFPQAARQERYASLMVYKLPMEDVRPLSQAFFKLET
uniref:ATP-binding cassette, sub-family A member 8a n=1 Tax=Jaculus jaculus TaxID=51337 RepID=A0A8C5JYU5_JACJA